MLRRISNLSQTIKDLMHFTIKFTTATINCFFLIIYRGIRFLFNRFRFSIAFKINLLYTSLYSILLLIIHVITCALIYNYWDFNSETPDYLINDYSLMMCFMIPFSFFIFLFIGRLIVNKMLKPIKDMTEAVNNIQGNDLFTRLDTHLAKDELKDLTITFNEMMERLEAFVERQKQFASDASHELRTPIAIIQGYAEMLQRWGKDDPQILEESILSIAQETQNMKTLLEKLLFLSRSDKNTLVVDFEIINLSQLCKQILKETSFIDDEHEFIPKISENIQLFGDKALIKELIRIFIDNALKYTPEGGSITLSCVQTKKNVVVSIKDTGIGINEDHLPHLFDRFYRVDEARNKKTGGTGLGLAIAKQISNIHHAKIYVNSVLEKGTDFIIFFPIYKPNN